MATRHFSTKKIRSRQQQYGLSRFERHTLQSELVIFRPLKLTNGCFAAFLRRSESSNDNETKTWQICHLYLAWKKQKHEPLLQSVWVGSPKTWTSRHLWTARCRARRRRFRRQFRRRSEAGGRSVDAGHRRASPTSSWMRTTSKRRRSAETESELLRRIGRHFSSTSTLTTRAAKSEATLPTSTSWVSMVILINSWLFLL